ncbi:MAG: hypothetical protein QM611_01835 [Microbacterium sp.]|uniref:hypothetical protein n=1 Tax=Microbacterium sp. TaxID=51671 RepID=UPI0039E49BE4
MSAAPTQPPHQTAPPTAGTPDTRPKTLALVALILGAVGFVLSLVGFLPLAWVSLGSAILGGLLLLVALVLAIVALASKKQGGTGLGIGALVVSVVGGIVWAFAILVALVWMGLTIASEEGDALDPTPQASVTEEAEEGGTYDEAAYLAEVRPAILALMQSIDPSVTEAQMEEVYTDDTLVGMGAGFAALPESARETARELFSSQASSESSGTLSSETAGEFFDILLTAAEKHLVQ